MDGKLRKISPLALSIAMLTATAALAGDEKFDTIAPGTLPADWKCGVTGKGSPVWKVEADASAPSKPNVLRQSGTGTFPWCVKQSAQITDGFVEVKFKPLAGRHSALCWMLRCGAPVCRVLGLPAWPQACRSIWGCGLNSSLATRSHPLEMTNPTSGEGRVN